MSGSTVALHPGVVQTDLARYIIGGVDAGDTRLSETAPPPQGVAKVLKESLLDKVVLTAEKGANTQVFLAAAADNADGALSRKTDGFYFDVMKPAAPTAAAIDAAAAKQLWAVSERLTGAKFEGLQGVCTRPRRPTCHVRLVRIHVRSTIRSTLPRCACGRYCRRPSVQV